MLGSNISMPWQSGIVSLDTQQPPVIPDHNEVFEACIDWYDFTKKQINSWKIKYHKLLLGKPTYDIFVDDRAVNNKDWYKHNNLKVD